MMDGEDTEAPQDTPPLAQPQDPDPDPEPEVVVDVPGIPVESKVWPPRGLETK